MVLTPENESSSRYYFASHHLICLDRIAHSILNLFDAGAVAVPKRSPTLNARIG